MENSKIPKLLIAVFCVMIGSLVLTILYLLLGEHDNIDVVQIEDSNLMIETVTNPIVETTEFITTTTTTETTVTTTETVTVTTETIPYSSITWSLEDGVLNIIGSGALPNWDNKYNKSPWYENDEIQEIVFSEEITYIGTYAFAECKGLIRADIPDHITSIGGFAFSGCSGVTNIIIPANITELMICTFQSTRCTHITIPDGVTHIQEAVFNGCDLLTSVSVPASVTRIEFGAFGYCTDLTDVYYAGTEEQWKKIQISAKEDHGLNNIALTSANIHYNSYN